jgi:hypothetical protein
LPIRGATSTGFLANKGAAVGSNTRYASSFTRSFKRTTPGHSPHKQCPIPAQGRHEYAIDRNKSRQNLRAKHRAPAQQGAWANIPPKQNRKDPICFSPHLYRARNLVERFFNKIKQCRRVATRYDNLTANYLVFIKLAS